MKDDRAKNDDQAWIGALVLIRDPTRNDGRTALEQRAAIGLGPAIEQQAKRIAEVTIRVLPEPYTRGFAVPTVFGIALLQMHLVRSRSTRKT